MNRSLKTTVSIVGILLTMTFAVGCGNTASVESGSTAQTEQGNRGQRPGMFQRSAEETKALLAPLVTDKTITQQQADSVASFLEKQAEERKNMAGEGRRQQWNGNQGSGDQSSGDQGSGNQGSGDQGSGNQAPRTRGQRPNPLSELVTNGTITQEQSDKIAEVLFPGRGTRRPAE